MELLAFIVLIILLVWIYWDFLVMVFFVSLGAIILWKIFIKIYRAKHPIVTPEERANMLCNQLRSRVTILKAVYSAKSQTREDMISYFKEMREEAYKKRYVVNEKTELAVFKNYENGEEGLGEEFSPIMPNAKEDDVKCFLNFENNQEGFEKEYSPVTLDTKDEDLEDILLLEGLNEHSEEMEVLQACEIANACTRINSNIMLSELETLILEKLKVYRILSNKDRSLSTKLDRHIQRSPEESQLLKYEMKQVKQALSRIALFLTEGLDLRDEKMESKGIKDNDAFEEKCRRVGFTRSDRYILKDLVR